MECVANRWTWSRIGQDLEHKGQVCTVRDVYTAVMAVASMADPPREERMPQYLKEVLESWGDTWMWKALRPQAGRQQWVDQWSNRKRIIG